MSASEALSKTNNGIINHQNSFVGAVFLPLSGEDYTAFLKTKITIAVTIHSNEYDLFIARDVRNEMKMSMENMVSGNQSCLLLPRWQRLDRSPMAQRILWYQKLRIPRNIQKFPEGLRVVSWILLQW